MNRKSVSTYEPKQCSLILTRIKTTLLTYTPKTLNMRRSGSTREPLKRGGHPRLFHPTNRLKGQRAGPFRTALREWQVHKSAQTSRREPCEEARGPLVHPLYTPCTPPVHPLWDAPVDPL
eukprot:8454533-Pyramimonas_sp.AAC.1